MTERLLAGRLCRRHRTASGQPCDRLMAPVLDVTDTAAIRAVLASAFRQLGRIDVLVSNAGCGLFGAAEELTDAQIDHQIATNLSARSNSSARPFRTCGSREVGELFKFRPKAARSHTRPSA